MKGESGQILRRIVTWYSVSYWLVLGIAFWSPQEFFVNSSVVIVLSFEAIAKKNVFLLFQIDGMLIL